MLSKKHRIQKKKDIERIFKEGKSFREGFLVLKTAKNNLNIARFGFIVSQKISKKANVRNKIKRRLREMVRLKMKSVWGSGTDNLFITLPGIEKKEFKNIEETIEKLFKKAKINVQ
jgi:ribonuclease P protein component